MAGAPHGKAEAISYGNLEALEKRVRSLGIPVKVVGTSSFGATKADLQEKLPGLRTGKNTLVIAFYHGGASPSGKHYLLTSVREEKQYWLGFIPKKPKKIDEVISTRELLDLLDERANPSAKMDMVLTACNGGACQVDFETTRTQDERLLTLSAAGGYTTRSMVAESLFDDIDRLLQGDTDIDEVAKVFNSKGLPGPRSIAGTADCIADSVRNLIHSP